MIRGKKERKVGVQTWAWKDRITVLYYLFLIKMRLRKFS
jgi:hypothetical protein